MKRVVLEEFGTLEPFNDDQVFGARRKLPKGFERATAMSKRIARAELNSADLPELLISAAQRLAAIYRAAELGRDLSPADQAQLEIEKVTGRNGSSQGFNLSPAARKAIEVRAMYLASDWLQMQGFTVSDCSGTKPFDFLATRGGAQIKVEVKGTTSDCASAILMTSNEVELHRQEKGETVLIVCSSIRVTERDGRVEGIGGIVEPLMSWDIDEWLIQPTAYRVSRPR